LGARARGVGMILYDNENFIKGWKKKAQFKEFFL
jgi:hypothetical protein